MNTVNKNGRAQPLSGKDLKRHIDKRLEIGALISIPKDYELRFFRTETEAGMYVKSAFLAGRILLLNADQMCWRVLHLDSQQVWSVSTTDLCKVLVWQTHENWLKRKLRGKRKR